MIPPWQIPLTCAQEQWNLKLIEPLSPIDVAPSTLLGDRSTTFVPENCLES